MSEEQDHPIEDGGLSQVELDGSEGEAGFDVVDDIFDPKFNAAFQVDVAEENQ